MNHTISWGDVLSLLSRLNYEVQGSVDSLYMFLSVYSPAANPVVLDLSEKDYPTDRIIGRLVDQGLSEDVIRAELDAMGINH